MEVVGEDLQVQVFALSHNAPNQEMSLLNEDVAIASEVVTEKSEVVEIEKELVIQKKFIVKEKILVPKKMVTFPPNHSLGGHASLFIETNDTMAYSKVGNQDSQEFNKMEIASQESVESRMDISSQESSLSQMECSSQEAEVLSKPVSYNYVQNKKKVDIGEAACHTKSYHDNCFEAQVLSSEKSTSEKFLKPDNDSQISIGSVSKESKILKEDIFQDEFFEITSARESGVSKRKADILADGMSLSSEKCLLLREEAVVAREKACMSREKAIKECEAALVRQGSGLLKVDDSPSPKRLKVIGIFECN